MSKVIRWIGKPRRLNAIAMKIPRISLMFALVAVPTLFGYWKMPTEMGLSIGAIGLALVFANLEKFARFKGAGFEAELRDVVQQTYAALDELKELALCLSSPIVDELAVSGQMMTYLHLKYKLDRVRKIAETLGKLGATNSEVEGACSTLLDRVTNNHIDRVLGNLKTLNPEKQEAIQGVDNSESLDAVPKALRQLIHEHQLKKDQETDELIADVEHFIAHKTLRRENKWQS